MKIVVTVLALIFAYLCGYTASAETYTKTQTVSCSRADGQHADPAAFILSRGKEGYGIHFVVGQKSVDLSVLRTTVREFSGSNSEFRVSLVREENGEIYFTAIDLTGQNRTSKDPIPFNCK